MLSKIHRFRRLAAATGFLATSALLFGSSPPLESPLEVADALAFGDYDGDGLEDLFVFRTGLGGQVLRNSGDGSMQSGAELSGLDPKVPVVQARWIDLTGDGRLDLSLLDGSGSLLLFHNIGQGGFEPLTGAPRAPFPFESSQWVDYDQDGLPDLLIHSELGDALYHNEGAGHFVEVRIGGTPIADRVQALQPASRMPRTFDGTNATPSSSKDSNDEGRRRVLEAPGFEPGQDHRCQGGCLPARTTASSTSSVPGGTTSPWAAGASSICSGSIEDQSGGACLQASSSPTLGMLHPISADLYISATTGQVGLGTTSPSRRLDVAGSGQFDSGNSMETLKVLNNSGNGAALYAEAQGGGAVVRVKQVGPGPLIRAQKANGDVVFEARNEGITARSSLNGLSSAAVVANNTNSGQGNAIYATAEGTGTTGYFEQTGSGAILKGQSGSSTVFVVDNAGRVTADDGLKAVTNQNGLSSAAVVAENTSTGTGNAIYAKSNGTSTTGYFEQLGSGPILRGRTATDGVVFQVTNTGRVITSALEITGGGDLVEGFEATDEGALVPGTVVAVDPDGRGGVRPCQASYDRCAIGVVSGAGNVRAGIRLSQEGILDGDVPVALTGRVYVRCTSENGPIEAGDLLTSAATAGHAMKATDPSRAFGAVIGKALTPMDEETGLVLVLVSLQ